VRFAKALATMSLIATLLLGAATAGLTQGGGNTREDLDYAQILFVRAVRQADGAWGFDVTVRHNDEGWDHYADAWQVVDPDSGAVIAERVLAHPHEDEQPFTRGLNGIRIPGNTTRVLFRARCNRHGFGGREILVDLGRRQGEGFEVSGALR